MKEINYKAMGTRIRNQRELLGYTREQLAERLEVSTKFCSDIELGIKGMSINTLAKLSEILCFSTEYILFGDYSELNQAEEDMLLSFLNRCPSEKRSSLITIIRSFVEAIE